MAKNKTLGQAKKNKKDEFYTLQGDIEQELRHYHKFLKGKVIYMNCDDPAESEFWRYFVRLFNILELKGLIATHYDPNKENYTYKLELKRDNVDPELEIVGEELVTKEPLLSNGDFRSACCIELLEEADVVVTNPPFSLYKEYITQLIEYKKDFIVWANTNSITYKEVFPYIKDGIIKQGETFNKTKYFRIPDDYEQWDKKYTEKMNDGYKYAKVPAIAVFTSFELEKRKEHLDLRGCYYKDKHYPKYLNYDGIEVSSIDEIPCDYDGVMGVPITYLDKHNPDDFEIIGIDGGDMGVFYGVGKDLREEERKALFKEHKGFRKGKLSYRDEDGKIKVCYRRILIKNKHPEPRKI